MEIGIKGKGVSVPAVQVCGRTVISTGKWLKVAGVHDEELTEGPLVASPDAFLKDLGASPLEADLFTFCEKLESSNLLHPYHSEWDNLAVIPVTTFAEWWEKRVESSVRRAVRKASKAGLVIKVAELDDAFVNGIVSINNETPIRQGRPFWHYQKAFEAVKRENSTYAARNMFLGAYLDDELIGFIRMTRVDNTAHIIQLLSMIRHYDKRPANALIAKAVEVCAEQGLSHLVYCNYTYNDPNSSLTEFKRRNGFEKALVPRYYIPLTGKGTLALRLRLHRGFVWRVPTPVLSRLLRMRGLWYSRRMKMLDGVV